MGGGGGRGDGGVGACAGTLGTRKPLNSPPPARLDFALLLPHAAVLIAPGGRHVTAHQRAERTSTRFRRRSVGRRRGARLGGRLSAAFDVGVKRRDGGRVEVRKRARGRAVNARCPGQLRTLQQGAGRKAGMGRGLGPNQGRRQARSSGRGAARSSSAARGGGRRRRRRRPDKAGTRRCGPGQRSERRRQHESEGGPGVGVGDVTLVE